MLNKFKSRYRFRLIIPSYPTYNIYSNISSRTTALGPVYIATIVNKMEKWDVEIVDENNLHLYAPKDSNDTINHEYLQAHRPADVVGFYGGLTSTIPRLYKIAKLYKKKGAITVAGGQHFVDENIDEGLNNSVDYIVIGEGEDTINKLLEAICFNNNIHSVSGIAFLKNGKKIETGKRDAINDFNKLPLPDFSLVRYAKIKLYPVEFSRGCGMDCEFCTVKGKPRFLSIERSLEQIKLLVETRNACHFFIVDDFFGQDRETTIELCDKLHKYQKIINKRLDITVQMRIDKANDTELLLAMRKAGVNCVAIGYESPINEELKAMNKHITAENMLKYTKIFHKYGFLVHGMFIFGYPINMNINKNFFMTANKRAKYYKKFIREADIDSIQILNAIPLPGTQLRKRLEKQKRIYPLDKVGWEYYDGNYPVFEPDRPLGAFETQKAAQNIMCSFYRFHNFFKLWVNILFFPTIIFFFHNIKYGWKKWYRVWRNDLLRFLGWSIIKKWKLNFEKDTFTEKLQSAKGQIKFEDKIGNFKNETSQ